MTPVETVTGYLDEIEWTYRVISPTRVLTTYRCSVRAYYYVIGIEVVLFRHWVQIRALLQRDISSTQYASVLQLITDCNSAIHHAKFLLVDGCVVLQAEIPTRYLSRESFLEGLSSVCRYSELAGVEIAVLATNPTLRATFDAAVAANRTPLWDQSVADDIDLDFDFTVNRLPDPIAPPR